MTDDAIIAHALQILDTRYSKPEVTFSGPQDVKDYFRLQFAGLEREVFGVAFLNTNNGLLRFEVMFTGTLAQTSVYPREVAKRALALNAASVVLSHNHPSGLCEPSRADEYLTQSLKTSLALIDVRVLDHVVVGGNSCVSFAERGLL